MPHRNKAAPEAVVTTIDIPPSYVEAAFGTIDEDARTVELVFSTGATFPRFDWFTGKRYNLRLSLNSKHVRLDRLNSGAPLLNAHSSYDLSKQVGVVVDKSAVVSGKEARCKVRFSRRPEVEPIWQDVKDRIIRNVSVGATIHKFEERRGANDDLPLRTAIDWEPFEVSLVPIGADAGAKVKAAQLVTNPCVVVNTQPQERSVAGARDLLDETRAVVAKQQLGGQPEKPARSSFAEIYAERNKAFYAAQGVETAEIKPHGVAPKHPERKHVSVSEIYAEHNKAFYAAH